MITGWFDLYGQETGEKLSEIQKQVDAMMERIQRLQQQKSATENLQGNPNQSKNHYHPPILFPKPLPETEKSSVDENISTVGGAEQKCELTNIHHFEFPIVETFLEPLPCTKRAPSPSSRWSGDS